MRWGVVIGLLAGLLWCGSASAGTYDVYGCRLPDGSPAATDGWSSTATQDGTYAWNDCARRGGLTAGLDPAVQVANRTYAAWSFDAPSDTTISAYSIQRTVRTATAFEAMAGRNGWFFHDAPVLVKAG